MKKILSIIALLFISHFIQAQEIPISIIDRINTVDYIFEGEVINSVPYLAPNSQVVYTSNLINITKILKGNLSCGTVELITAGGEYNNRVSYSSHTLMPDIGDKGIFLCRPNRREAPPSNFWNATNPDLLGAHFEDQSFISYSYENNQIIAHDILGNFDSIAQLYNLAQLITGFNFQDCNTSFTSKQQIDIPNPDISEIFKPITKQEFNNVNDWINYQRTNYKRKKQRNNSELTYSFVNPIVTGTTTKYFEFDIRLVDNQFNKYFDWAIIRIKYPTSIFDTNVVANNKISFTRGNLIADTNCYSKPTATDFVDDAFYIDVSEKVYSQCKAQITNVPNTLVHVKMQMKDCIPNNSIHMEDTLIFGGLAYLMDAYYADSPNDTFSTVYDTTFFPSPANIPNCVATITSFSPDTVRGGIGDTLFVRGFQFGPIQGNGNLFFINGDAPTSTNYLGLEPSDIALWSDTLIKIIVPSIDKSLNQDPISSCKFRITTNNSQKDTADTRLTIFYSLYNYRYPTGSKVKDVMGSFQEGGYRFYVDTLIYKNDSMMWCIKKAMYEWSCATGVNFEITKDTFGLSKFNVSDFVNHIYYSDTLTAVAQTQCLYDLCPTNMKVLGDIDIAIAKHPPVPNFYDTLAAVPSNRADFFAVIMHEIGHAVQHNHINDTNAIMYAYQNISSTSGIPVFKRKINIMNDKSAYLGGRKEVSYTLDANATGCGHYQMTLKPICSGYTSIVSNIKTKNDIEIFPNPFSSEVNIKLEADETLKEILVYDLKGQLLFNKTNFNIGQSKVELPKLSSDIYILKVITNKRYSVKKVSHE
jgi:hypothetical protein